MSNYTVKAVQIVKILITLYASLSPALAWKILYIYTGNREQKFPGQFAPGSKTLREQIG